MRQIVLDTETTGLNINDGNRVIEIGCVEIIDRKLTGRHYHQYINAQRDSEEGALAVHGITTEFLSDKPLFHEVAHEFLDFVRGAELVIHNAPFDMGFLEHEFSLMSPALPTLAGVCTVLDTLVMAKQKYPGQKNNLDALSKRLGADTRKRDLHGALLDAEILADVYLFMTGGQTNLLLGADGEGEGGGAAQATDIRRLSSSRVALPIIGANDDELRQHSEKLNAIDKASDGQCVWLADSSSLQ